MIYFITGGQRSGKSSYAQRLALTLEKNPIYLATSRTWDDDHGRRIERHRRDRGPEWITVEEEKWVSRRDFSGKTVVMDCITLWLTNFFQDNGCDVAKSLDEAGKEFDRLIAQDFQLICVSNEIGMGVHAGTESGRKFTDLQGWMNQRIAEKANEVILMVSGIPVKIKG